MYDTATLRSYGFLGRRVPGPIPVVGGKERFSPGIRKRLCDKAGRAEPTTAAPKTDTLTASGSAICWPTACCGFLPQAYANAGEVHAMLAAAPGAPVEQRREDWIQARDSYRKSVEAWEQIPAQPAGTNDWAAQLAHARA